MRLIKILLLLQLIISLNSCGPLAYKKTDARQIPTNATERVKKNMEEGKGFRLSNLGKSRGSGTFEFASSNPLWRASLETLDFLPLYFLKLQEDLSSITSVLWTALDLDTSFNW